MTQTDRWNPGQYNKFRDERKQPFFDLAGMVHARPGMRVIDLGCGTGELTAMLAELLPDSLVEGIDSSEAMLAQASVYRDDRVSFRLHDVAAITDYSDYDLIFSNAVLQWVPDNESVLKRILQTMRAGAQVAVQVPKNEDHPSHRLGEALAEEQPFRDLLHGYVRRTEALALERYSTILYEHGLRDQVCIEKIYGHELSCSADVVEWVKGTSLNAYLSRLAEPVRSDFLDQFRCRLLSEIGDRAPYFYPFRRLLFWGQKSGPS